MADEKTPTESTSFVEDSDEEKKLVRKIDMFLMPTIWVLYCFSFMDRTNIGNAKVAGMDKDLGLTSTQYFLAIVVFQVGYVIAEVPSNMILSRTRPSRYVPFLMLLWGSVAALMSLVKTPAQLLGMRFLLGVMEAGFSPAVLFIISSWYRRHEQSKRFMCFLSAGILSGAFGGIIAGAITKTMEGAHGIAGWRWLFIVEGVATVGIAFIAPFCLLDYPATSKQLTQSERDLAVARLKADGITSGGANGEVAEISHWLAFVHAVSNWRLWLLCAGYMTIIGCYSLSYFNPVLVSGLGYKGSEAQYMTVPLYVVAFAIAVPSCIVADRIPRFRPIMVCAVLVGGSLFCALSAGIYAYIPRYVFLCFINSAIWTANPLSLSFASVSMGPLHPETRAVSLAILNGMANLAQIYGSYLFPAEDAPKYLKGFGTYSGLLAFGAVVYVSAFFLFRRSPFKART
ncbi:MFS general substrate transporter [Aaosphaeria arxii CBS 175.79]|uniref:MFS general substrate transporter n=1 Tax=Aaosphaeria arxii CBS 175.79 TaxID=1450172 RepID=A0A6A5YCP5_9PLEO|nr:MFS general substrate transporter [Aaosphaeria arxii CBS 175.79]KAF2022394.1 MFS general substrate transporter [Aaosphaeria arxii CBS 175.79]